MKKFKKLAAFLTSAALACTMAAAPVSAAEYQPGDANMDGNVNIADVIFINRALLGDLEMTPEQAAYADVDGQDTVSATDSLTILKYIVELVDELTFTNEPTDSTEPPTTEESTTAETTTTPATDLTETTDPTEPEETGTFTTTSLPDTTTAEVTTTVDETTFTEETTADSDITTSAEETTTEEDVTTSEEDTTASAEETTTAEDTTASEEETTTEEDTTASAEETTTEEDTTASAEETTTEEGTTTSEEETTSEDVASSDAETTTTEETEAGLTGETEVRVVSTDADGNTVVYVARGDVLEIAVTGGEPNANLNGGIGYNDPETGDWTDPMINWNMTLDEEGNGATYFEIPDGLASLQFQTWYYGLGSETFDKAELDMTFTVQLDPEQMLSGATEEREATTDADGNLNVDVTGAVKLEITIAGGETGVVVNGCVGYYNPTLDSWMQVPWDSAFGPDGTAKVYITVPEGVTSIQYQLWYAGVPADALTTTFTVQLAAEEA